MISRPDRDERSIRHALLKTCKTHRSGVSTADLAALSGVALPAVRQAAPVLADEYRGRVQVSERGELLWSFPHGFTSRYSGFLPRAERALEKARSIGAKILSTLFKGWILFTLVAYFILFILLSIASVVALSAASMAGNSEGRSSRRSGGIGGFFLASRFIELAMRLWLYSEITRPSRDRDAGRWRSRKEKKTPLHQSIFDFVFGPPNPNADLAERQTRAFANFVTANGGVISLGEYIGLSADSPKEASDRLLAWCSRFEGQVDVDEEGAVLYRFDALLERNSTIEDSPWPQSEERAWSKNKKGLNRAFILINGVNLAFGTYFVWQHLHLANGGIPDTFSVIYQVAYHFAAALPAAGTILFTGLGLIPLAFSLLFWLIPLVRHTGISRFNRDLREKMRANALRKSIWAAAKDAKALKIHNDAESTITKTLAEISILGETDSHIDSEGNSLWRFKGLEREARALEHVRVSGRKAGTGNVIFDSHGPMEP